MIRKLFKYFVIKSYVVSVDPVPTVNMVDEWYANRQRMGERVSQGV